MNVAESALLSRLNHNQMAKVAVITWAFLTDLQADVIGFQQCESQQIHATDFAPEGSLTVGIVLINRVTCSVHMTFISKYGRDFKKLTANLQKDKHGQKPNPGKLGSPTCWVEAQATQAHELSTVLFSIFIDFAIVWEIHFGSKNNKISHKKMWK